VVVALETLEYDFGRGISSLFSIHSKCF
jgi:hypothetical protein